MRVSRTLIGVGAVLCLGLAAPSAEATKAPFAAAVAGVVTLDLQFNEPVGATVAIDGSGLGHNGAIGNHLKMNGSYADWDRHPPGEGIYYGAAHLIVVDDATDGSLDPGTGNFSIEFRLRTTDKFGNIIQKGQSKTVGGQIKFQQPGGFVSCMYKSPTGRASVKASIATNDGAWHVIRCDRTPSEVTLYIDGVFNKRIRNSTGNINNSKPWTIGGKFDCDTSNPETGADSCDLYPGDLDYVILGKG